MWAYGRSNTHSPKFTYIPILICGKRHTGTYECKHASYDHHLDKELPCHAEDVSGNDKGIHVPRHCQREVHGQRDKVLDDEGLCVALPAAGVGRVKVGYIGHPADHFGHGCREERERDREEITNNNTTSQEKEDDNKTTIMITEADVGAHQKTNKGGGDTSVWSHDISLHNLLITNINPKV